MPRPSGPVLASMLIIMSQAYIRVCVAERRYLNPTPNSMQVAGGRATSSRSTPPMCARKLTPHLE